jgi:outer membrane receptor protein involved in Fe transport
MTAQGRWIEGGKVDKTLLDSSEADYNPASPISIGDNEVKSRFYVNVMASYKLIPGERGVEIYGVINNLTNVDPPFPTTQISGIYDRIGRYYRLGLRFNY